MALPALPKRVLVVDDGLDAAWAIATMLRMEGCEVREAFDGARAIDAAIEMRPDAILMDISMPGVNGIEAAAALRRLFQVREMPRLIAMTALDPVNCRKTILGSGFDAFLVKPFSFAALLGALRAEHDGVGG